jgi:TonB family protein
MAPEVLVEELLDEAPAEGEASASSLAASEEAGAVGDEESPRTRNRYAIRERNPDQDESIPREALTEAALEAGTLGVLAAMTEAWDTPTSAYSTDTPNGRDDMDALGALLLGPVGENFGHYGLNPSHTGRGGGDLPGGTIGRRGYRTGCAGCPPGTRGGSGAGPGGRLDDHRSRVPERHGTPTVSDRGLGSDVIRRVVRRNLSQVRHCYEQQLQSRPDLAGRVTVSFIISASGAVQSSAVAQSSVGSPPMEQCIARAVRRWAFPASSDGSLSSVRYPFTFQAQ